MAQKTTPKQTEIQLIKKLFALDGYFTAAFSKDDIVIMEHNINADYDLLCGTTRDESSKLSILRHDLDFTRNELDEKTKLVSDLRTERDAAIVNFRNANSTLADLQKEVEMNEEMVGRLSEERDEADEKLAACLEENKNLEEEVYEKAHEIERLKIQIIRRDLKLGKELTPEQKELLLQTLDGYED